MAAANRICAYDPQNATPGARNRGWREELAAIRQALAQLASSQEQLQTQLQTKQTQMQVVVDSIHKDMSVLLASSSAGAEEELKAVNGPDKHYVCTNFTAQPPPMEEFKEVKELRMSSDSCAEPDQGLLQVGKVGTDLVREKSSLGVVMLASAEEERSMLEAMFTRTEEAEEEEARRRAAKRHRMRYMLNRLRSLDKAQFELFMDTVMGVVICANAVFIGISMDHAENTLGWVLADVAFSALFISEISIKVWMNGFRGHFCGSSRFSNCFDFCLVFVDLLQLSMMLAFPQVEESSGELPSASLFRIVRLMKLTRLLRLLRSEIFNDLLCMIQGMMGGMKTLAWSLVLFCFLIYVLALLFREFFGRKEVENVGKFFNSVPRSMYTTFRCSFGDCNTDSGVPIFEYVADDYGWGAMLFYCVFVFVITIGLFNVISAIFVESTMVAAMALENSRKKARLHDDHLWTTRITTLIRRILDVSPDHTIPGKMSEAVDEIHTVAVARAVIDQVLKDEVARSALDDLDIDRDDHAHLSDILDPDNGGTIEVCELIEGLQRLRGDPKRSDIVSVDMMVRALQKVSSEILIKITEVHASLVSEE